MDSNLLNDFGIGVIEMVFLCLALIVFAVLWIVPAVLAYIVLERIPIEYRKQTSGLAFLLLIPFFGLIWSFFVHPKVSESLKSYYDSRGDKSVGDCGSSLATWLCICPLLSLIPLIGLIAGLAGFVLLIVFYLKAFELSSEISRVA